MSMKLYYIDRRVQIRHFTDFSVLNGLSPVTALKISVPSTEDFIIQLVAVPENEEKISKIAFDGNENIFCINSQITDKFGKSFEKEIPLKKGRLQPLFFVLPADRKNTNKTSDFTIKFITESGEVLIPVSINFTSEFVENNGYNDLWRLSRLSWLNSKRFLDSLPAEPYTLPEIDGNDVKILGRTVSFGVNALPKQITGYFDEAINLCKKSQTLYFSNPMEILFDGEEVVYSTLSLNQDSGTVMIESKGKSKNLEISINGILHYEGFIDYSVKVKALRTVSLNNISMRTFLKSENAEYINGLGAVGGKAENLDFKWTDKKHHDCLYAGRVNAGIRIKWKAENYVKPLVNIYYKNMPLTVPADTWDNHGAGSVIFKKGADTADITANTGVFNMEAGEYRHFDFELHITPLKPINYKKHYSVRYSHNNNLKNEFKEVDRAEKAGLNNIVIHHGNMVHPFINYPFVETGRMKALVRYAASKNIGVKAYYTTREHSNHMAEVFAYKALGDEIILRKKGEGYAWFGGTAKWLTEYFGEEIIPAWKVEYRRGKYKNDPDVSFIVRPNSRLDNYYVEGLDWLVKNIGIKGIYIDDTALDRTTIERAKKVLMQNSGLIDMHMWNHEEERAGDVSCMNLYTELFPFIDSLWIGEGYPYKNLTPDYLLTEVSGIPYGQTSQMLEGGGDPYIGMLYAMNNRYGWGTKDAPRIYDLWDSFKIEESEMRGYWHSKNPVKTNNDSVLATVYVKDSSALVCMFNFGDDTALVYPQINNDLLGYKAGTAKQVYIHRLQREKKISIEKGIKIKAKSGMIFLIEK